MNPVNLKFYKIELLSAPVIAFAHGYKSEKYDITMRVAPQIVEISHIERGDIIRLPGDDGEGGFVYGENGISVFPHAESCHLICRAPVQSHFTVGFAVKNRIETLDADELYLWAFGHGTPDREEGPPERPQPRPQPLCSGAESRVTAVLPQYIAPYNGIAELQKSIKRIIDKNGAFSDTALRLDCVAGVYELLAALTRVALRMAAEGRDDRLYAENIYLRRAAAYIGAHIAEKIYVSDVAASAGISYGYLNRLFYDSLGVSITDYINQLKLRRVKELMTAKNITVSEASRLAGIADPKYLSRLFKRYNGITAAEYKRLHNNADGGTIENMVIINKK